MAARATYRHLLRSARTAFHGDHSTLEAARSQIRDGFEQNAKLKLSDPKVSEHIKHAEDVASILMRNVVQGQKNGDAYKLRIHEHTERGDNDTVKIPSGQKLKVSDKSGKDK